MKNITLAILFVFTLLIFIGDMTLVVAQDDSTFCPEIEHQEWVAVAKLIYHQYGEPYEPPDIFRAAELQALRRQLDETSRAPCDDHTYQLLQNALNLSVDSAVASEIDNQGLARELLSQAFSAYEEAGDLLFKGTAEISSPPDGTLIVTSQFSAEGTYYPYNSTKSDLIIFAADLFEEYIPQGDELCNPTWRRTVSSVGNTWSSNVVLEHKPGRGYEFQIILMRGNDDAFEQMFWQFDSWCTLEYFPGFPLSELFNMGFELLDTITVFHE